MDVLQELFFSPYIMFFLLGILAGSTNSDLRIPEQLTKTIALILMLTIGMKGGLLLRTNTANLNTILYTIFLGILSGILIPILGTWLLRLSSNISHENAAALSAHYGSVSVVTFTFATQFLETRGYTPAGYMVAIMSIMEIPAILTGLIIANRASSTQLWSGYKAILKDSFLNSSVILLLGGLLIGLLGNPTKLSQITPFFIGAMPFLLCLFLLETGLLISKEDRHIFSVPFVNVLFALYMPLIGMVIGLLFSKLAGAGYAERVLFTTLCASASYIAVPAAMRLALPNVDHQQNITCSLGITFPFNILIGVPLYAYLARVV